MKRREFFIRAGALFSLPLIVTEIGCDDSYDSGDEEGNGDNGGRFSVTSSNGTGHTHTVTISLSDVNSPPMSNETLTTSSSASHTHQITLTPSDFENLALGETVMVTSTTSGGHSHSFSIRVP